MRLKIFYSWQNDTDASCNRFFIRDCIDKAVARLRRNEFSSLDIDVIDSVGNDPGAQPIADRIAYENIPNSDIFIADLSIVNNSKGMKLLRAIFPCINNSNRYSLNGNVVKEYGNAQSKLGQSRIIGVVNTYYGEIEKIHFDLRHYKSKSYCLSSKKDKNKSETKEKLIQDLVWELKNCINSVLNDQRERYWPFIPYSSWVAKETWETNFCSGEKINDFFEFIARFLNFSDTNIRVLGISGTGKTRCLLEFFQTISADRRAQLLYLDYGLTEYPRVYEIINRVAKEDSVRIIIIDNCPIDIHRRMTREIAKNTKIKLISIDSDLSEMTSQIDNCGYYTFEKNELNSVVRGILTNSFPGLSDDQLVRICEFAFGNPMMAILLANNLKQEKDISKLSNSEIFKKLLGEEGREEETRIILQACSLFDYFGFDPPEDNQAEFIAKSNVLIPTSNTVPASRVRKFKEVCNKYIDKQLFDKRGHYIGVRPLPLAIHLATQWFENCSASQLIDIIKSINEQPEEYRVILCKNMCRQMRMMAYIPQAEIMVKKLMEIGSPFVNAEILNSDLGSQFFCSFAEVNPVATGYAIFYILTHDGDSRADWLISGRRNVVWALDKICFRKESFEIGMKSFAILAIDENESYANNSTNVFLGRFRILLAGTESDFSARIPIILWLLSFSSNPRYITLALKALTLVFQRGPFSRLGGAEQHGTKKLNDYEPRNVSEIRDYCKKAKDILFKGIPYGVCDEKDYSEAICEALSAYIAEDLIDEVSDDIVNLVAKNHIKSIGVLRVIAQNLDYSRNISDLTLKKLKELNIRLQPQDIIEIYEAIGESITHNNYMEQVERQISEWAKKFLSCSSGDFERMCSFLLSHNPRLAFMCGSKLYETDPDAGEKLLSEFNNKIVSIPISEFCSAFFRGYLSGFPISKQQEVAISLLNINNGYYLTAFEIAYMIPCNNEFIDILFGTLTNIEEEIHLFAGFEYSYTIMNNLDGANYLLQKLMDVEDVGGEIIFNLLYAWVRHDKIIGIKMQLPDIVAVLSCRIGKFKYINLYDFWEVSNTLINRGDNVKLAKLLLQGHIASFDEINYYHGDDQVKKFYSIIVEKYFQELWIIIANALMGQDYYVSSQMERILGARIGDSTFGETHAVIEKCDIHNIVDWVGSDIEKAKCIVKLYPFFAKGNSDFDHIDDIMLRLIDIYGDKEEVLSEISSYNFHSFSWVGSVAELYIKEKKAMETLLLHRHQAVQDWAKSTIAYLNSLIEYRKNKEIEEDIIR